MMVSGKIREIVCKCLEMNPNDRYQTVDELENALSALYNTVTETATPLRKKDNIRNKTNNYIIPGFRSHTWWKSMSSQENETKICKHCQSEISVL